MLYTIGDYCSHGLKSPGTLCGDSEWVWTIFFLYIDLLFRRLNHIIPKRIWQLSGTEGKVGLNSIACTAITNSGNLE